MGSLWRGTEEGPWGRDAGTPGFEDMAGTQDGNSGPLCARQQACEAGMLGLARETGQPLECEMTCSGFKEEHVQGI